MERKPSETMRILTIDTLERLNLSSAGNPRFKVTFTNGESAQTQSDASVNYGIENSEYRGVPLKVTFSPNGRITYIEVAKSQP
ncbi:hypothetical protein FDA94_28730 [Herbidospora galbida]|uniref:Uncharacterized protein n=1 Tax=Herbidospora galbida TaxID=2575442 RepID=A0A4U3MAC0_9ACTN|nr:hypothetical protein [Herbidospora galbida]TKK84617.1 hypothetical protein FDA94_28730 [Herbidospora galbida]